MEGSGILTGMVLLPGIFSHEVFKQFILLSTGILLFVHSVCQKTCNNHAYELCLKCLWNNQLPYIGLNLQYTMFMVSYIYQQKLWYMDDMILQVHFGFLWWLSSCLPQRIVSSGQCIWMAYSLERREMEVPTASVSCIEYEENAVELCPWYL